MTKISFKNQLLQSLDLFPINLFDKIPSNQPVRLVNKVDALDISEILKRYKGGACSAYHSRMMLKVLFYAYLSNIYSCRKRAKSLGENTHFMFILGNSVLDSWTINYFHGKILKEKTQYLFLRMQLSQV